MKISPNRGVQPPSLGRPLLAHKYAGNTVGHAQPKPLSQKPVVTPVTQQRPLAPLPLQSPGITTRRTTEEEHQAIDINLNINVNTGGGSKEFKINMNGKQQTQPLPKPLSPAKVPVRALRTNPQPALLRTPAQQILHQGLPHRVPSPSRGLRIPSPQRGGRMVAMPSATLLPPQSVVVSAPQVVVPPAVRVSNLIRTSQAPISN